MLNFHFRIADCASDLRKPNVEVRQPNFPGSVARPPHASPDLTGSPLGRSRCYLHGLCGRLRSRSTRAGHQPARGWVRGRGRGLGLEGGCGSRDQDGRLEALGVCVAACGSRPSRRHLDGCLHKCLEALEALWQQGGQAAWGAQWMCYAAGALGCHPIKDDNENSLDTSSN